LIHFYKRIIATIVKMMDSTNMEEDIFYSDDEFSDSEIYNQGSGSNIFSSFGKQESIFSSRAFSLDSGTTAFSNLNENHNFNTIDSPITQISSGIQSLLKNDTQRLNKLPGKQLSYSSMAKKEPLQPQKPQNIMKINKPAEPKKPASGNIVNGQHVKVAETALSAGYRFKARNPEADPRYPQDQQLMVGPIPGNLEHDVIYNSLRSIFQSRGPVCFMFVHKSAVKDNESGKPVKFGYVVFAEKGVAQKVLREGNVTLGGGHKIKVREMLKM